MKNTMLKTSIVAALMISGSAFATSTAVCAGSTTASSVAVASSTSFIKQTFDAKCSSNVWLSYDQDDVQLGVCSASKKGNFKFGGNTAGGAVAATGAKASSGFSSQVSASTSGCA